MCARSVQHGDVQEQCVRGLFDMAAHGRRPLPAATLTDTFAQLQVRCKWL